MLCDERIIITDEYNNDVKIIPIPLNFDKNIYLIQCLTEEESKKRQRDVDKFIRNQLILVGNHVLTSTFADTIHFMTELKLYDTGNKQNKYLSIAEYQSTKNLKLKGVENHNIFISKSEAWAMYQIYNISHRGYSTSMVLENEFKFTPQVLTKVLNNFKLLGN